MEPHLADFFQPLKADVLAILANEEILESCSGTMAKPSSLMYIPPRFTDSSGNPFTLTKNNEGRYLSKSYLHSDWEYIALLGVKEMTVDEFLVDLQALIDGHSEYFQAQSVEWHSELSQALLPIAMDPDYLHFVSALRLIPLRDGRWISGDTETGAVFFPGGSDNCVIPDGIDVSVVSSEAVDPARDRGSRLLFSWLGVGDFDVLQVCRLIVRRHKDPSFNPASTTLQELISQTTFIFTSGLDSVGSELWFACENDGRFRGHQLYMDSGDPHAACKVFANHRNRFKFLHKDYLSAVPHDEENWLLWLRSHNKISVLPRLVRMTSECSFELASDFEFLTQLLPSPEFLLLLRDHWTHYAKFLDNGDEDSPLESERSSARLNAYLSALMVGCHGEERQRIDKTFLPLPDLMSEAGGCVPFLDIPEPEDKRWRRFEIFGVGIGKNVSFYLRCLESVLGTDIPKERVIDFLDGIEARYTEDEQLVK
jgi:hypothetical protein